MMNTYLITFKEDGQETGVLLGKQEAETPSEAIVQEAYNALDDEVQDYDFTNQSIVGMATEVLDRVADKPGEYVAYKIAEEEQGAKSIHRAGELDF